MRLQPLSRKVHLICTFICLPCGQHHRTEVGIPPSWIEVLPEHGTFHELLDWLPEIFVQIEEDPCLKWVFQKFAHDHGSHDIRFITTPVCDMPRLMTKRSEHFKKTLALYEQYRALNLLLERLLKSRNPVSPSLFLKDRK